MQYKPLKFIAAPGGYVNVNAILSIETEELGPKAFAVVVKTSVGASFFVREEESLTDAMESARELVLECGGAIIR